MPRYETYHTTAAETPSIRGWIVFALLISLLIHSAFLLYAYRKRLQGFKPATEERMVAPVRVFQMKQVAIPMEEPAQRTTTKFEQKPANVPVKQIEIPVEKPVVQDVLAAPQITDLSKQLLVDKPKVEASGQDLSKLEAGARNEIDKELASMNTALLKVGQSSQNQPSVTVSGGKPGSGTGDAAISIPGMQSIDDALAQTGPLHAGDKAGDAWRRAF